MTDLYNAWLYSIPDGWHGIFIKMCAEIYGSLIEDNMSEEFFFLDVKEKYGQLRCYCYGGNSDTFKIIDKYESKSVNTCCKCGGKANWLALPSTLPICDACRKKNKQKGYNYIKI